MVAKEKSQEVQGGDAMDRLHAENNQMRQQMQGQVGQWKGQ